MKNPNQMSEKGLPDPQLKFVHEVNNEHPGEIKVRSKTFNKCILDSERRLNNVIVKLNGYKPSLELMTLA